ncbi:MAG: hypothetical protein U1D55_03845 [Phycisphaerae bacterium]
MHYSRAPWRAACRATLSVLALLAIAKLARAQLCTPSWTTDLLPQMSFIGVVDCAAYFDDGAGPALYVGGAIRGAGATPLTNIAKWNGVAWQSVGSGLNNTVWGLAVHNGTLVAVGQFTATGATPINRVAAWNGSSWQSLGSPTANGTMLCAAVFNNQLHVGGSFSSISGVSANNVARWTGAVWQALDIGMLGTVYSLQPFGGELIAGGIFTTAGGASAPSLAAWNGTSWRSIGGTNGQVRALTTFNSELIVGGLFSTAGGLSLNNIARWNGSNWFSLGVGVDDYVRALTVSNGALVVSGAFRQAGGLPAEYVARWNGASWQPDPAGVNGPVFALASHANDVCVAGAFTCSSAGPANSALLSQSGVYSTLAGGLDVGELTSNANALGVHGGRVHIGGLFTGVNGTPAIGVAVRGAEAAWTGYGAGLFYFTGMLGDYNGDLIAGGSCRYSGSSLVENIARWNGTTWMPFDAGLSVRASDLGPTVAIQFGSDLVVAGTFSDAAGLPATRNLAAWNGVSWHALGAGVTGAVNALTVLGNQLIVGGAISDAGGVSVNRIAAWDGISWSALGGGLTSGSVQGLAVYNNELYAAGSFQIPNSNNRYIARWDGTNWQAPGGSGANAVVSRLLPWKSVLVAGGSFITIGGVSARGIATWNGANWAAFPSNLFAPGATITNVSGLVKIDEGDSSESLYVLGFDVVSGATRYMLARWGCSPCPGDANGDRAVNESDLGILLQNWLQTVAPGTLGDVTGDSVVNESDLGVLLQNWQHTCP